MIIFKNIQCTDFLADLFWYKVQKRNGNSCRYLQQIGVGGRHEEWRKEEVEHEENKEGPTTNQEKVTENVKNLEGHLAFRSICFGSHRTYSTTYFLIKI